MILLQCFSIKWFYATMNESTTLLFEHMGESVMIS